MDKYLEIIANVRTVKHANHCLMQLDDAMQNLFNKKKIVEEVFEEYIAQDFAEALLNGMKKENVNLNDRGAVKVFLLNVKEYIEKFPFVELTLAYYPTHRYIVELAQWFEVSIGRKVFIKLSTDPSLIGGAIISYKGNSKDYTLLQAFS